MYFIKITSKEGTIMGELIKAKIDKSEILELMNNTSLFPFIEETKVGVNSYTHIPISRLGALGTAFQPLVSAVQMATTGAGGSGIYYVNTGGKTMFQMKGTTDYIGALQTTTGKVGGGQAKMIPLACDPTMIFMAAALVNIDKKLDIIKEMQQDIMNFLIQKEKSKLNGNLNFLYDVLNNYKYNWDNEMYKNSNHIKVLDIRQSSEQKILFYREQIISKINKKSFFHSDSSVKKQLEQVQEQFKYYQLSLYLLAFSSFLEVILLSNYDEKYLNSISNKIEKYSLDYRELYTQCYSEIEGYSSSSVESMLLNRLSKTSSFLGKTIKKIPVVSKGKVDQNLIATGDKILQISKDRVKNNMKLLIERQTNYVRPFIENINTINQLYNNKIRLMMDDENIYIGTT